jgi:isoleucyl-tRNA synthetase
MWSPVERTALADAEVEYHEHVSPTIWVKFPVADAGDFFERLHEVGAPTDHRPDPDELTASVVIWTTTPWTIPGNRAIAYGPDIAYGSTRSRRSRRGSPSPLVRPRRPADRRRQAGERGPRRRKGRPLAPRAGRRPRPLTCMHPLAGVDPGYRYPVPLLAGSHVTDDAGTGFVHTAPSHGQEDYQVWLASGRRDIPDMVDENGAYYAHVPLFAASRCWRPRARRPASSVPPTARSPTS